MGQYYETKIILTNYLLISVQIHSDIWFLVLAMSGRGCRVYIGNLPSGTREKDLERFVKGYGIDILIKQGFGFVEFDDYSDADHAVYELNGKEI